MAVIGQSGSGKSTWLQLLSGILAVQEGDILYGNVSLKDTSERQRDRLRSQHVGLIFQNNHFLKDLNISQNLTLPAYAQGAALDRQRILHLAEQLNVDQLFNRMPSQCSVGELQRLSILRTASTLPSFILADEPTSALDDRNATEILNIFSLLSREYGIGIMVVTHDQRVKSSISNSLNFGV